MPAPPRADQLANLEKAKQELREARLNRQPYVKNPRITVDPTSHVSQREVTLNTADKYIREIHHQLTTKPRPAAKAPYREVNHTRRNSAYNIRNPDDRPMHISELYDDNEAIPQPEPDVEGHMPLAIDEDNLIEQFGGLGPSRRGSVSGLQSAMRGMQVANDMELDAEPERPVSMELDPPIESLTDYYKQLNVDELRTEIEAGSVPPQVKKQVMAMYKIAQREARRRAMPDTVMALEEPEVITKAVPLNAMRTQAYAAPKLGGGYNNIVDTSSTSNPLYMKDRRLEVDPSVNRRIQRTYKEDKGAVAAARNAGQKMARDQYQNFQDRDPYISRHPLKQQNYDIYNTRLQEPEPLYRDTPDHKQDITALMYVE